MKAIQVRRPGGPSALEVVDLPEPSAERGEVVLRVLAASINPTDLGARAGVVPKSVQPPFTPGWDFSAEVVSVGDGASRWAVGDRVVGMIPWYVVHGRVGAYAERIAVDAGWLVPLPEDLDPVRAATIPLNALTAVQLLEALEVPAGGRLLVTGASGGVGAFVVQLAVRAGLDVTAVAGGGDEDYVRRLGAKTVLPRDVDYATVGAFSHVVDAVPVDAEVLSAVADGGHVIATRPPRGAAPRSIRHDFLLIRPEYASLVDLVRAVADGELDTRVDRILPLARAAEGHRVVEDEHPRGKIVLVP